MALPVIPLIPAMIAGTKTALGAIGSKLTIMKGASTASAATKTGLAKAGFAKGTTLATTASKISTLKAALSKGGLKALGTADFKKDLGKSLVAILITGGFGLKIYLLWYFFRRQKKSVQCTKCFSQIKSDYINRNFKVNSIKKVSGEFTAPEFTFSGNCPHCNKLLVYKDSDLIR